MRFRNSPHQSTQVRLGYDFRRNFRSTRLHGRERNSRTFFTTHLKCGSNSCGKNNIALQPTGYILRFTQILKKFTGWWFPMKIRRVRRNQQRTRVVMICYEGTEREKLGIISFWKCANLPTLKRFWIKYYVLEGLKSTAVQRWYQL